MAPDQDALAGMSDALEPLSAIFPEPVSSMSNLPISNLPMSQSISQPMAANTADRSALILGAYESYQETMRQFLGLQERIMNQFLSHLDQNTIPADKAVSEMPVPPMQQTPTLSQEQLQSIAQLEATIRASEQIQGSENVAASPAMTPVLSPATMSSVSSVALLERIPQETRIAPVAAPAPMPAVVPVAVAAPAAMPGLDPAQATQMLLDIVSDRTGYPAEMLGLDQDMEAELGIDSIKRVEILGAFQKMLPTAVGAMVQDQMENLTRVKSLKGVVDRVVAQSGTVAPAAAPVMAVPIASPAPVAIPSGLDPAQVTQMLLDIVSDRTGYPAEMLGLDQDMEAELGIDSIKRVEILGAFQKMLPTAVGVIVQDQMESLTRVKSLKGVADQVVQYSQGSVALGK
jgi:acyl carrier protein